MTQLTNYLEKIDLYIEEYCKFSENKVSNLASGISREEVDRIIYEQAQDFIMFKPEAYINYCNLQVSDELYQLYQWHNGQILESFEENDSFEYVNFLEKTIKFYPLQNSVTFNEYESEIFLFSGGDFSYYFKGSKEHHQESVIYDECRTACYSSLTNLMKELTEGLDMILNLLSEKGNFDGDEKDRLESWNNIIKSFPECDQTYYWFDWLSIEEFLNAALNVRGCIADTY